ncbi:KTSC domain-containing protein [Arcticibacter pallidicorallinus]|uniref:KTSC domain-containing protein n=1 Tax=Arcticibacter pallidicorallinus TaxID=1259464 RepID=A0A2T0TXS8_9SPHI|nr:KTSC domain-containing protein [Arcticibacter pallidicorallinus]
MPSSVISSYHFEPSSRTLTVVFLSGMVYEYQGVPESLYDEMKAVKSKGTFLNKRVKGVYPYRKLT